ncbi:MAG: transaldolase, partial [Ignavibacteriales bacterium]|nr:transaldolase [Ignavibacteriales bacterium]
MSKLHELANYGQSIWLDYIRRDILENGELQSMIDDGVRGMTSNPTIFEKAIAGGDLYDEDVEALAAEGKSALDIYDALSLKDIHKACELLSSVYKETEGADGYVSVEVSPELAHDTEKTIAEARRLREATPHDNLMIKVPATNEGIPAVKTLIAEGVNVNVTLIFSVEYYRRVAEAYIAGLEERAANGEDVSKVASVASFFVSRVDTQVDAALEAKGEKDLQGTIAVANSKIAYAEFQNIFSGDRWEALAAKGAKPQRPLWASTGTKNPAYSDVKYVDELIASQTVNTVPPDTLDAFLDHGAVGETATKDVDAERERLAKLGELGVDLEKITDDL